MSIVVNFAVEGWAAEIKVAPSANHSAVANFLRRMTIAFNAAHHIVTIARDWRKKITGVKINLIVQVVAVTIENDPAKLSILNQQL